MREVISYASPSALPTVQCLAKVREACSAAVNQLFYRVQRLIAFTDRAVSKTKQLALKLPWLMNRSVHFDLLYMACLLSCT